MFSHKFVGWFQIITIISILGVLVVPYGAGATISFTPDGPTQVTAGTDVRFTATVTTTSFTDFDAATIGIGTNGAGVDIEFSSQWLAKFDLYNQADYNMLPEIYSYDVLISSGLLTSVGSASLSLGTVVISTDGLAVGDYWVKVDNTLDTISSLSLLGDEDPFSGYAAFSVASQVSGTVTYDTKGVEGYPLNSVTIELHQGSTVENHTVSLTGTGSPKSYSFLTGLTGTCDMIIPQNSQTGWFGDDNNTNVTLNPSTTANFSLTHAGPGDADMDGTCGDSDVDIVNGCYPIYGGTTWAIGDFNGDGNVDDIDIDILNGCYAP